PACVPFESAPAAVPIPDLTPDGGRNMPRAGDGWARGPWTVRLRQLLPLEVLEQECERAVEHHRRISVGHLMPKEVLHASQLVVRLTTDGDLHLVTLGRERCGAG